jgi:hypothetical protein
MWMRVLAVAVVAASLVSAQPKKPSTKAKAPAKAVVKEVPPPIPPGRALPPPKDETTKDKALVAFLAKLKADLKVRSRDALLSALAADVDPGVRDMRGPNAFYTAWGLSDADSSAYGVLTQILSMPGVWVGEQFCAPYVSVQFPADLDRSKHQVVLNPNLKVYAANATSSKVVATVSYEIVQVLERGPEWTKVRLQSGVEGYIQIAYLYSPAGYRACFSKSPEGAWHLQSLAAPR